MPNKSKQQEIDIRCDCSTEIPADIAPSFDEELAPKKPAKFKAEVMCGLLNVRESPSYVAPILTTIKLHTIVTVDPSKSFDGWYKVNVGGYEGYCASNFIEEVR